MQRPAPPAKPPGHRATDTVLGWGDAIYWNDIHHTTPYPSTRG